MKNNFTLPSDTGGIKEISNSTVGQVVLKKWHYTVEKGEIKKMRVAGGGLGGWGQNNAKLHN